MSKLFYLLHLLFYKIAPLYIIISLNFRKEEEWNYSIIALFLVLIAFYFLVYKPIKEKIKVWEIQDKNSFFVVNFNIISSILLFMGLLGVWHVLHSDYQVVYDTLSYVIISLIASLIFRNLSLSFEKETKEIIK